MTDEKKYAPSNIDVEQALLGAILINNDAMGRVIGFLEPGHFYEPLHGEIYRVAKEMITAGKKCSPITIKTFLPEHEEVAKDVNVAQYLARLAADAATIVNAEDFGRALYALYLRRMLITVGEDVANIAYDAPVEHDVHDMIEESIARLLELDTEKGSNSQRTDIQSITADALSQTSKAYSNEGIEGIEFPLAELGKLNQGPMEAGNLYGLLGGTKEGKSSLTAMIMNTALQHGHPVLVNSYDQTGVQWARQMAAQHTGIDANRQRKGETNEDEFKRVAEYFDWLNRAAPFQIIKCRQENAERLAVYATRFLRRFRSTGKIPLIITDHVGKIPALDPRADAGKQAGQTNQIFKSLAGEYGCVWINLIQRNSAGTQRKNPRPVKKDIYGGEGAVADYDAIFYVYREAKWLRDQLKTADERDKADMEARVLAREGLAELGLIAHRFAPEHFTYDVKFIEKLTKYESLAHENEDMTFGEGF